MDVITNIFRAFQDLADNLKDRITSPVSGTFISIWIIWNWKVIYFFLNDDGKSRDKISHIETFYSDYINLVCWPFGLTIAYLILFPIFKNIGSMINIIAENCSRAIKAWVIEKATFLTSMERAAVYRDLREQNVRHSKEIADYQERLDSMNTLLANSFSTEERSEIVTQKSAKNEQRQKTAPTNPKNQSKEKPDTQQFKKYGLTYQNSVEIVQKGLLEGIEVPRNVRVGTVSYTHLTLPTIYSV